MNKNNIYRNQKIEVRSFFGIIKNGNYFLSVNYYNLQFKIFLINAL